MQDALGLLTQHDYKDVLVPAERTAKRHSSLHSSNAATCHSITIQKVISLGLVWYHGIFCPENREQNCKTNAVHACNNFAVQLKAYILYVYGTTAYNGLWLFFRLLNDISIHKSNVSSFSLVVV